MEANQAVNLLLQHLAETTIERDQLAGVLDRVTRERDELRAQLAHDDPERKSDA